jgi:flagellar basal-body rod modification protein FlgD
MSEVSGTYTNSDLYSKYGVDSTKNSSSSSESTSNDNSVENTFMELLLAELTHQNPMEPMDSSEMISQMAQMNTVQQLESMAESMKAVDKSNKFLNASSLIGKQVAFLTDKVYGEGIVSAFSIEGDNVTLLVNDHSVPLSAIIGVSEVQKAEE